MSKGVVAMRTPIDRVEAARAKALAVFDRIIEIHPEMGYVEIVASVGGDIVVRRYYDNGMETDR